MSDNRYFSYNCPALMHDGRFITNYTQRRTFDQYIRGINKIVSAQDYKDFLQRNGESILNKERAYNEDTFICKKEDKCVPISEYSQSLPQILPKSSCFPKF
jgi:hypothetical protein